MKVVLLKEVSHLGKKGDVKEVVDGYARNYLIPLGFALAATESNIAKIKEEIRRVEKQAEDDLVRVEKIAMDLDGLGIEIAGKVNDAGKLYAAIGPAQIAAKLKEKNFEIKKNQIVVKEPIKEPGEYEITVNLEHGLEAKINLIVSE